ncbi:unnamed protein product, partial [Mesorhabditis belari]|uniref:Lethal protein 858 n=1 Tax=Mesorhabditis belari TaxID=2138241 RepID=A0AAF3J7V8_9BILA
MSDSPAAPGTPSGSGESSPEDDYIGSNEKSPEPELGKKADVSRKNSKEKSRSASPKEKSPRRRESKDRSKSRSPRRSRRKATPERRRSRDRDRGDRDRGDRGRGDHERSPERRRGGDRSPKRRRRSPSPKRKASPERRRRSRSPKRHASPERRKRSLTPPKRARREESPEKAKENEAPQKEKKETVDLLRSRTGGAYIPPAKLKLMQEQIQDKSGEQFQRLNWERLKKKIHGLVNKVNASNLVGIVRELLQENIIRGKGLLTRSIIQAQAFSPTFSHVYAGLVGVINSKFPVIGELTLKRLIVQFKRSFRRNDKATTVTVSKFLAHLINQQVAHELLALEIMLLMLKTPTEDSVEVCIAFLKECGAKLTEIAPRALDNVFSRLRNILAEAQLDSRIRYMIETAMAIRRDKFADYPALIDALDLISEEDQITHTLSLEDATDPENMLNIFKLDPDFEKNEAAFNEIREQIIGDAGESEEESEEEDNDEEGDDEAAANAQPQQMEIIDNTEQNLVAFRREVYLTIQSSLDYQEAAHKLLKMGVKPELEPELIHMLVDCCAQQRTYERFYGLLCERFCRLKREFQATFETIARETYQTIHRFDITKLRNMARLISHLLFTDAITWDVLSEIHLNENETTSSGRIYIKTIFLELAQMMGLPKLYERICDPTLQHAFEGLFPRDNPANTRFAINFFTLIGLGGLTVDLREFLEKGGKRKKSDSESSSESSSSSSDDDSESGSDTTSSSSSDSDSSDD